MWEKRSFPQEEGWDFGKQSLANRTPPGVPKTEGAIGLRSGQATGQAAEQAAALLSLWKICLPTSSAILTCHE
ncbi:hypothetical protein [Trichothermofontia sp.]